MARYVDFRRLKDRVSIADVIAHYGFPLTEKGESLVGDCPLCGYEAVSDADADSHKFKVTVAKGAFKCFGCGEGGNVIDLVAKREDVSIRNAAALIAEWFAVTDCDIDRPSGNGKSRSRSSGAGMQKRSVAPATEDDYLAEESENKPKFGGEAIRDNPPLEWDGLKTLTTDHEAIVNANLDAEVLEDIGAGYCTRGMMAGRLAVPIRNREGALLAYCGVALDGKSPRLKFPPPEKYELGLDFYNYDRALASEECRQHRRLTITDDIMRAISLESAGYDFVISTMQGLPTSQQILRLRRDLTPDYPSGFRLVLFWSQESDRLHDVLAALCRDFYVQLKIRDDN